MSTIDRRKAFDAVLGVLLANFPRQKEGQMWKDWKKCERYLPHALFLRRRFEVGEEFEGQKSIGLAKLLTACTWYRPKQSFLCVLFFFFFLQICMSY